jgi:hypothetical protein
MRSRYYYLREMGTAVATNTRMDKPFQLVNLLLQKSPIQQWIRLLLFMPIQFSQQPHHVHSVCSNT